MQLRAAGAPPAVAADFSPAPAEVDEAGALASAGPSAPVEEGEGQPLRVGAEGGSWPDEAAEATFLAGVRERGEALAPAKAREEIAEETEARPLPALDTLVQRIPPDVREVLDDLFRARFVRVARVPGKALQH